MTSVDLSKSLRNQVQDQINSLRQQERSIQAEIARLEQLDKVAREIVQGPPKVHAKPAPVAAVKAKPAKAQAPKAKPAKTDGPISKSDFIRQHSKLSAREIVEAAAAQGITLSTMLVYTVRANDKSRGKAPEKVSQAKAPKAKPAKAAAEGVVPKASKSDIVRSRPDLTPTQLQKWAETQGITISAAQVSVVRSSDKARARKLEAAKVAKPAPAEEVKETLDTASEEISDDDGPSYGSEEASSFDEASEEETLEAATPEDEEETPEGTSADEAPTTPPAAGRISLVTLTRLVMGSEDLTVAQIVERLQQYPEGQAAKNLKNYVAVLLSANKGTFERVERGIYRVVQPSSGAQVQKPSAVPPEALAEPQVDVEAELAKVGLGTQSAAPVANPFGS